MIQATYMLTYRADREEQRRRNLDAVPAWLTAFAQIEIVVVEQDVAPTLVALPHPRCQNVSLAIRGRSTKAGASMLTHSLNVLPKCKCS